MNAGFPTQRQIAMIARQEGADGDVVREALRRMGHNPRVRDGEVQSPAAFFRGILRGVLADREPPAPGISGEGSLRLAAPQTPPPSPPPDADLGRREAGLMSLRARRLFADGADQATVLRNLTAEFPSAPQDLLTWALITGAALHNALTR